MSGWRKESETRSAGEQGRQGLAATEERHEPQATARTLGWYVALLVGSPFVLILGTLVWMSTAEYQRHAQYPSFVGIGYGSRLRNANCEVLIDGDSSAMTGVMPRLIEARTGLKTCNIAEVAGVKKINGFMELDDYLAHNRPPRVVLFLFVPENLTDPARWLEVATFEGWFYRLRFHRDRTLLPRMLQEPDDVVTSAELGLRTGLQWMVKRPLPPALAEMRERSGGRLAEPGASPTECPESIATRAPDAAWLRSLRQRYSTAGTRVMIDVTPEPVCDTTLRYYQARTGGAITDNTLQTLPLEDYTDTGRLHTNDQGAASISNVLASQIIRQMNAYSDGPMNGLRQTAAVTMASEKGR